MNEKNYLRKKIINGTVYCGFALSVWGCTSIPTKDSENPQKNQQIQVTTTTTEDSMSTETNQENLEWVVRLKSADQKNVEEKMYTASTIQELNQKVFTDLKSENRLNEDVVFEAKGISARDKNKLLEDSFAELKIGKLTSNFDNYSTSSRTVIVQTSEAKGAYVVSSIEKDKLEPSQTVAAVQKIDLPKSSKAECLINLSESIACEAASSVLEVGFDYIKGEKEISPTKPGLDFSKDVALKTVEKLSERYSEEFEALKKLHEHAESMNEIYNEVSEATTFFDLSLVVKKVGIEKIVEKCQEIALAPLDERCEEIAEQVKQSCSEAFSFSQENYQKKQEKIDQLLPSSTPDSESIKNVLREVPAVRENIGGKELNVRESITDLLKSKDLPSDFSTRKEIYETINPGEKYVGDANQNIKFVHDLTKETTQTNNAAETSKNTPERNTPPEKPEKPPKDTPPSKPPKEKDPDYWPTPAVRPGGPPKPM